MGKKVLIIKHGALGDVVLSMYAVFSINKHFDSLNISVLTESKYVEIFNCLPFISNIRIDNRPRFYFFYYYLNLIIWFYKSDFDWVFDLQTSKRTNFYFYIFSLFKKVNWNGIAKTCSHPHLDCKRIKQHTVERQKQQLKCAGIKNSVIPNWNLLKCKNIKFNFDKPYAILVPGGSRHRVNKRWSFYYFLEIIKFLKKKKITPVLIGGSDEIEIFKGYQLMDGIQNLIGKTNFSDLVHLAYRASLILGNDTGPMHLLVACSGKKTKKIVLFGEGSDPKLCAPLGKNLTIIRKKNINNITPKKVIFTINKNN